MRTRNFLPRERPLWDQEFRGKSWWEMPGTGVEIKKMNFFFWRRGMTKYIENLDGTGRLVDGKQRHFCTKAATLAKARKKEEQRLAGN